MNVAEAECWSDEKLPDFVPSRGDYVSLPVSVRSYVQGGNARHTLCFGPRSSNMEDF
jgi:hypothetical protein